MDPAHHSLRPYCIIISLIIVVIKSYPVREGAFLRVKCFIGVVYLAFANTMSQLNSTLGTIGPDPAVKIGHYV